MNSDVDVYESFTNFENRYAPFAGIKNEPPPYNPLDDFPRSITGEYIPIEPDKDEKKRIRYYYSMVGLMLIFSIVVISLLSTLLLQTAVLGVAVSQINLASNELYDMIYSDELIMSLMNIGVFLCANLLVFFVGCRVTKICPADFLKRGQKVSLPLLITFVFAGFFIQSASSLIMAAMPFEGPDYSYYISTPASFAVASAYYIIIAPIGEELLIRGFVLKNLSRANTRFGIFASSFLFGLYHGNARQLISGFMMGLLLAYIAVYTNSLRSCIIVHSSANAVAVAYQLVADYFPKYAEPFYILWNVLTLFFGLLAIIYVKIIIPKTQTGYHHKTRGFSVAKTSIPFMAACGILLLICVK